MIVIIQSSVSVSKRCCNKGSQTGRLNTERHPLTVWRPEILNQGSNASGEDPSGLAQLLVAPGIPWLVVNVGPEAGMGSGSACPLASWELEAGGQRGI